ncbi:hypothetical protein A9Q84_21135 [Halobacteriovorax marinus]|uniref:Uncharacterized protein n=1 Tax=Halobacteriovorax marinus TaxID=97084 RepID=A0A1Y5F6X8_9BACT|nr:hypothetical protein A9Q84_21135 [Halobacteriovorax marinus]
MSKENLQNAINDIMTKNAVNAPRKSFDDKKILQYENDLISSKVLMEFNICIAELCPEEGNVSFGGGDFTRVDYSLSWKKWNDGDFKFVLTNIKYSNSKLLIECPEKFKKDVLAILPDFISELAKKAGSILNS